MSEDTRFQSPEEPPTQDAGPSGERYPAASATAGFLCAGLLASVGALVCLGTGDPPIVTYGSSACGPVAGMVLWLASRGSFHYFARGALVFGVVCFVMSGACLAFMGLL